METYGYSGKILEVDLTTEKVTTRELDMDIAREFYWGLWHQRQVGI